MPEPESTTRALHDLRSDTQVAAEVDAALMIAAIDGIGRAMDYMQQHGVDHLVAIRVLASPYLHRKRTHD